MDSLSFESGKPLHPLRAVVPSATLTASATLLSSAALATAAALTPSAPPARASPRPSPLARGARFLASPPLWLTLLACAAILAARRPDALFNPQFWAEDGTHFFHPAWDQGWSVLFAQYAGYLHTVPRLVAACAVQFDPRWSPAIFVGSSFALTLYVAARTQSSRFPFPPHAAYAFAVVLVPDQFEVLLFLVNVQWILAGGLLLLLVSADARRWWQHTHDALAAILLGLTGPFSVLFAPLFLWRAWHRRTRASFVVTSLVLICAGVQAWTLWKNPVVMNADRIATEALLAVPGMRIAGSLLAGSLIPLDYPLLIETALGALILLAAVALALRRGPARPERIWLALAFGALLAASLLRCRYVLIPLCHATFGSRYFFLPQLVLLWLLAPLLRDTRPWLARSAAVLLLWILAVNVPRLRESGLPDLHWREHAAQLRAGTAVTVPINPGWSFTAPARPR